MDIDAIQKRIKGFLKEHKQAFYRVSTNQSKALELAVTVGASEHYRCNGYNVHVVNPKSSPSSFNIKTSTRGHPWNFSHLKFERDGIPYEAHMNLMVRSAHDRGKYCVDLGITKPGSVPSGPPRQKWEAVKNENLVTFAEVKKLVVYPMLLAQFIGIVHEIKPRFIYGRTPRNFLKENHLFPALASLGNFSGNSSEIVTGFRARNVRVTIAENFDVRLARVRGQHDISPFVSSDVWGK